MEKLRVNNFISDKSLTKALIEVVERRSATRISFITEAVVTELKSGAHLSGRSCDLVEGGCYVDTINAFTEGAAVRIRLKHGNDVVEADGRVVYKAVGMGMGLAFNDMSEENQATLDKWLSASEDRKETNVVPLTQTRMASISSSRTEENPVAPLIQVLREKGILTRTEAANLLKKPVGTLL